jgi:hypothetical protein
MFTSTPEINAALNDSTSAFSLAQGVAYLTSPRPVRVIPSKLYTVSPGGGGAFTENTPGAIAKNFGITGDWKSDSGQCIDQPALLAGTRRHESEAPDGKSHKGNCLKALRALDPVKFAEALVKLPAGTLNFQHKIHNRAQLVVTAAKTHDIVDENQTRDSNVLVFVPGATIFPVNADDNGAIIGSIWNPTTSTVLGN